MSGARENILDPLERSSEIIFGLIMALTFTSTISLLASKADVRMMLAGALGCNLAWGIVDASMYLLGQAVTRERLRSLALAVASAPPDYARRIIVEIMPLDTGRIFTEAELDRIASVVRANPIPDGGSYQHQTNCAVPLASFCSYFYRQFRWRCIRLL